MFKEARELIATIREKDPAAHGAAEIIFAYPGFHAVMIHRLHIGARFRAGRRLPAGSLRWAVFSLALKSIPKPRLAVGFSLTMRWAS